MLRSREKTTSPCAGFTLAFFRRFREPSNSKRANRYTQGSSTSTRIPVPRCIFWKCLIASLDRRRQFQPIRKRPALDRSTIAKCTPFSIAEKLIRKPFIRPNGVHVVCGCRWVVRFARASELSDIRPILGTPQELAFRWSFSPRWPVWQ